MSVVNHTIDPYVEDFLQSIKALVEKSLKDAIEPDPLTMPSALSSSFKCSIYTWQSYFWSVEKEHHRDVISHNGIRTNFFSTFLQ